MDIEKDDILLPNNNWFTKKFIEDKDFSDPIYLGFILLFNFNESMDAYGMPISPLLNLDANGNNAYNYLKVIDNKYGTVTRSLNLKMFIEKLQIISKEKPWHFYAIENINNVIKFMNFEEPYLGGKENKIILHCYESIDMRISELMHLYFNSVYDLEYRRILLPENLRKFEVYIIISDIRNFNTKLDGDRDINKETFLILGLNNCEFIIDDSLNIYDNISMNENTIKNVDIAFTYENVILIKGYFLNNEFIVSSSNIKIVNEGTINNIDGGVGKLERIKKKNDLGAIIKERTIREKRNILDKLNNYIEERRILINKYPERIIGNIISNISGIITNKFERIVLGNVYGPGYRLQNTILNANIFSLGAELNNKINNENIFKK